MALSDDEKKLLSELQAREAEPDADDNFEIEVYDTAAGKGARLPFKQGRSWLHANFGIGDAPAVPPAGEGGAAGDPPPDRPAGYFGRAK